MALIPGGAGLQKVIFSAPDGHKRGLKLSDLLGEEVDVAARCKPDNLKLVPVLPYNVQGLRANAASAAEHRKRLHAPICISGLSKY